jgi:predicted transcriptional regulator
LDIYIDSIKDLSALEDAKLVESNNIDLFKATEIFQRSLMGFKFLKGIFPYFHPRHDDIISYWIDNDCTVELILPDEVTEAVKNFITDYVPKSKEIKNRYVRIIPNDINIQFAFTVSDKCLVLAFYHKSGEFNQNAVIASTSKDAIIWGLKLFDEYRNLCGDYISLENIIYPKDEGV